MTDRAVRKYEYILADKINGNISSFKKEIKKLSKLQMLEFIEYAETQSYQRHIIINNLRALLES